MARNYYDLRETARNGKEILAEQERILAELQALNEMFADFGD